MKTVAILFAALLLVATQSSTVMAEDELFPDSLLNWLRIIQCDSFRLVHTTDRSGYYYAIYVDKDGDVLIANHCHDDAQRRKSCSYRVTDVETNKDLHDLSSTKEWPDSKKVTYSRKSGIGPLQFESSITNSYPVGALYPLIKGDRKEVRVEVNAEIDDRKHVLLDEVIPLVKPNGTKK